MRQILLGTLLYLIVSAGYVFAAGSVASDAELEKSIVIAIEAAEGIRMDTVKVSVQDGVATFSGHVKNHREIDRILADALMVEGVQDIRSNVTVGSRKCMKHHKYMHKKVEHKAGHHKETKAE